LYSLRYRLKAELNWYFDLADRIPADRVRRVQRPLVRYLMGGRAHQRFVRNTIERLLVIIRRGGIIGLSIGVPFAVITMLLNLRFRAAATMY
jgi:hypothetical protein